METLLANLDTYLLTALTVVGGLTVTVRGLSELAKLTKTEKDDAILAKVSALLGWVADMLDKVTPASKPKDNG